MVEWDSLSDQPAHMRDKKFKRNTRKKYPGDIIISAVTILLLYPIVFLRYLFGFKKNTPFKLKNFFGMSVNLDKEPDISQELIEELGVEEILIRVYLKDIRNISRYAAFAEKFKEKKILFNVIQDREHITDLEMLKRDILTLFSALSQYSERFQIGNAINRIKWGFVLPKEYLIFFKTVQEVRDRNFTNIKLIGPAVIDFEYHVTLRAMFNFFNIRYDALSSLLYVDRRGAPENRQFIFSLVEKINLLKAIAALSLKTKSEDIYITETNWPIENTGKYAPTSNYERVSEKLYTAFMVRYYLLAISTTQIKSVYWHQLVAPGYGLIDNREDIRKRDAFYAFKFMNTLLKDAFFITHEEKDGLYKSVFQKENETIMALWRNEGVSDYKAQTGFKLFSILGEELDSSGKIEIDQNVKYIIEECNG